MKLALAMIVAPTDEEALLLERCLESVYKYVDGIFLTITGHNEECEQVAKDYGANVSHYVWDKDFAKARTYNFEQVPKDYEYILWLDCDDVLVGGANLGRVVDAMGSGGIKGVIAWYLYAFDKDGNCEARHKKTRIVANDGSWKWNKDMGELHEDLQPTYECRKTILDEKEKGAYFEVHHLSNENRFAENAKRNLDIAKSQVKKHPKDPRATWNLANALYSCGKINEAIKPYQKFIATSGCDEERYLAMHRLATVYAERKEWDTAHEWEAKAMRLFPWFPDAYIGMGAMYYKQEKWRHAKELLIMGMSKDVSENAVVYNPRDYDQNPMVLLANCYFNLGKAKECRIVLEKLVETFPKLEFAKEMLNAVQQSCKDQDEVEAFLKLAPTLDLPELAIRLDELPEAMQSHPDVCIVRNEMFKREKTTGKQIDYYCGFTEEQWGPDSWKGGIGGSEEAVLNLTKRWAKAGYDVTVYNNCGVKVLKDEHGVTWKPYWLFNPRDKFDNLILWRTPMLADRRFDAKKVLVDMHDVMGDAEFTTTRIANIDKVLVKSIFHRKLFPSIPDDKVEVIGNGIDLDHFQPVPGLAKKPHSMIYTSSPDRGLEHLLDNWKAIKAAVPDATLDVYYGWHVFDGIYKGDPVMQTWKKMMVEKMNQPGIKLLGRVGHKEIALAMMQAEVFAYPCHFEEIFCISAVKAQAAGCEMAVTSYAALPEVVKSGFFANPNDWRGYTTMLISMLQRGTKETKPERISMFSWPNVAKAWQTNFASV